VSVSVDDFLAGERRTSSGHATFDVELRLSVTAFREFLPLLVHEEAGLDAEHPSQSPCTGGDAINEHGLQLARGFELVIEKPD
jgi:hypothetical protein